MKRFFPLSLSRFIVLAAALFCWVQALVLSVDIQKSAGFVSFRYVSDGISAGAAKTILEEDAAPFAAWRQESGHIVAEPEFLRKATVQILEVAGSPELVLPLEDLVYGFLPLHNSADTCAIDEAAAYALWGGVDVVGETLLYDGRKYTVSGVFTCPENTVLLQSALEKDTEFPYLELSLSGVNTTSLQADEFKTLYSLPEPDILTDHLENAAILRQLSLFPALIAAALLLWKALRKSFEKPVSFTARAAFAAALAAGMLISAWAIGFSPVIPAAAVPGRWSDFSFWSMLMKNIADRARLSQAFAWPDPDLLRLQIRHSLLAYSGGALAGFVACIVPKYEIPRKVKKTPLISSCR